VVCKIGVVVSEKPAVSFSRSKNRVIMTSVGEVNIETRFHKAPRSLQLTLLYCQAAC
jgi:hypothetical protein